MSLLVFLLFEMAPAGERNVKYKAQKPHLLFPRTLGFIRSLCMNLEKKKKIVAGETLFLAFERD